MEQFDMALTDVTAKGVELAIVEFDQLGRKAFPKNTVLESRSVTFSFTMDVATAPKLYWVWRIDTIDQTLAPSGGPNFLAAIPTWPASLNLLDSR